MDGTSLARPGVDVAKALKNARIAAAGQTPPKHAVPASTGKGGKKKKSGAGGKKKKKAGGKKKSKKKGGKRSKR